MRSAAATVVLLGFCVSLTANAQGTRADYERAQNLAKLTSGKLFKSSVRPRWFANNSRFWYRNDLRDGAREFVLVDAEKGTRQPAFDHERLAAALSKATAKETKATHLPIRGLEFAEDGKSVVLHLEGGKSWRCDLPTYDLREAQASERAGAGTSLPVLDRSRPSRRTGEDTSITFINRTVGEIEIFWSDLSGKRVSYGKLGPGDQRDQHTFAGHVWLVTDAAGKTLAVFEADDQPGTAMIDGKPQEKRTELPRPEPRRSRDAQSPDGKWQAFFKDNNLHLRSIEDTEEFSLSTDGTPEDEYSGRVFWSPDSKKVVSLRTKKGDERRVYYVESSPKDQLQPKLHSYSYLKPGDRVPQPKPQLFDIDKRKHVSVSDELFANPWSISDVRWEPEGRRFTFLFNQRGHQILRIVSVDAESGEVRPIVEEKSPTFIDYSGKFFANYLDRTGEIIWMSERDGWNHLCLYDAREGTLKNQITKGEWVVRQVDRVDEEARQIWFRAGGIQPGQDPYHIHFARVNFDGTGLTLLTEGDGTHAIDYSPDQRFYLDTWSRVDQPPVIELRRASDGQRICELEKADARDLLKTGWQMPERFVAKGRDGSTDIWGVIFRPMNFDATKKYPVIEQIYAGPQGSFTPKSFRSSFAHQSMAELGFIVVQMDGMGTSSRSKKFHDVCWKNLADAGFPDRILWMKAAAAKHPYLDLERVGIYGGSAGGQNSTGALLFHGDFYKVAVSDCGCHDNRMDKIWWNEQWMGWPVDKSYEESSNVANASKLKGRLMLVVGEMDENVDPASTMQVVNALVKADKDFELLVIPGAGHGSAESAYGKRRRADFFVRHLLGVEPRTR